MQPDVVLEPAVYDELATTFAGSSPREFVGLLAGARDPHTLRVTCFVRLPNVAIDDDRFEVDALAFLAAQAPLQPQGLCWLGFVHSHPHATARPSTTDRRQLWRHCLQLIVGGAPDAPDVRCWWLTADRCESLRWQLGAAAESR